MLDLDTVNQIATDVGLGKHPGAGYTTEMREAWYRMYMELQAFRQETPAAFIHVPPGIEGAVSRTDWDPDQPRAENGEWASDSSSTPQKAAAASEAAHAGHDPEAHLKAANAQDKAARDTAGSKKEVHTAKAAEHRAKAQTLQLKEAVAEEAVKSSKNAMGSGDPKDHQAAAEAHKTAAVASEVLGDKEKAEAHAKVAETHEKLAEKRTEMEKAEKAHEGEGEGEGKKKGALPIKHGGPDAIDLLHLLDGQLDLVHPKEGEEGGEKKEGEGGEKKEGKEKSERAPKSKSETKAKVKTTKKE